MITVNSIVNSKKNLVMTTAYDATMARRAIYWAFDLNKYTRFGGYYWKDLRPLLVEPDSDNHGWPKRRIPTREELASCRVWSLHGPAKRNDVPR